MDGRSGMWLKVIEGTAIPFIGTAAGSACVFFMKKQLSRAVQRALTGFARCYMLGYNDLKDPSVPGSFRLLAKLGDGIMKMQIVRMDFKEE